MKFKLNAKSNLCSEKKEYDFEWNANEDLIYWCYMNRFETELLKDTLAFDVEVIITKLYDLNDVLIPKTKWIDHNVYIQLD